MDEIPDTAERLSRRGLLSLTAAGGVVFLAGCLGDEDVPDPVSLDEGQSCDNCNMQIDVHPGPVGQAYYLDDPPSDLPEDRSDGVAYFCSSWCAYTWILEREEQGSEPAVIYTTDYSAVEEEVYDDGGTLVVSAHLEAEAFGEAADLTYVVDSEVEGAMGASLVGFSESADAEAFADEYGGVLVDHGDITRELVASL